jgi:transcriptional regulator with PAS, ATPase and Fis domain
MPRSPAPGRLVVRMLAEAAVPIFAIDAQRQIVFANSALGQWLGIDAQQLVGQTCLYHAAGGDDPLAAAAAGLCPPPEAFTGNAIDGSISRMAGPQHSFERRTARFMHIPGKDSDLGCLLVVVQPVTVADQQATEGSITPERLHALLLNVRNQLGKRFHVSQLVGVSDTMQRVRQQVRVAAEARARVLIIGPPGSGREHVARTIHYGQKSDSIGPLVPIDCALVDAEQMQASLASLLRSQHESPTDRPAAALLLDVHRLSEGAQQELAGFLHLPNIELHTLATSRRSLARLAAKGKFREDLAHELSTLTISVPPLARRPSDIPLLVQHFLEQANASGGRQLSGFQPAALELLVGLPWPGNIDELARAVREACERAIGPRVTLADLPDWVHLARDAAARPPRDEQPIQLDDFLAQVEKELLVRALRRTRGNKSKAAQLLGLSRPRLLRRLSQLGLISQAEADEPVVFEPLPDEPK